MQADPNERTGNSEQFCADRIGFAKLTTMAFHGTDLRPMRDDLMAKVADGTATSGDGLDLSLIAQLLGDKQTGLSIQAEVVAFHQLFRSAMRRADTKTARSCTRGCDRHGRQHADRVLAGRIRNRAVDALRRSGNRHAVPDASS